MSTLGLGIESTSIYTFNRSHCEKTTCPNAAQLNQQQRQNINDVTNALNIGDWVIFDNKMEEELIWLDRVMLNPEWKGIDVWTNETTSKTTFDNGVEIGVNEIALFVQWCEIIDILCADTG